MKQVFIAMILLLTQTTAFAWKSKDPQTGVYQFKFQYQGEKLEIEKPAGSYEEAFQKAAEICFKHYRQGKALSEDQGLDIIDVCANPRS